VKASILPAAVLLCLADGAPAADRPIVVAVVDSGVDQSVPGLVTGWNAIDGSTNTRDTGHGTGVAQVVAAGCGGCRILPVRITDESRSSTQGVVASGIRWAAEHGARVINLSWGSPSGHGRQDRSSARSPRPSQAARWSRRRR
jgi:subtilisin family serine protease